MHLFIPRVVLIQHRNLFFNDNGIGYSQSNKDQNYSGNVSSLVCKELHSCTDTRFFGHWKVVSFCYTIIIVDLSYTLSIFASQTSSPSLSLQHSIRLELIRNLFIYAAEFLSTFSQFLDFYCFRASLKSISKWYKNNNKSRSSSINSIPRDSLLYIHTDADKCPQISVFAHWNGGGGWYQVNIIMCRWSRARFC